MTTATTTATSDPRLSGGHTIVDWAIDELAALSAAGVPVTPSNVQALVTWANHESGGYTPGNPVGLNNPLNTTQPQPASGAPPFDVIASGGQQGNIKGYGTYAGGIAAQAFNLLHTTGAGYENIIAALRQGNNPNAVLAAVNASRFGTKGLPTNLTPATSVPAYTNGTPLNVGIQTVGLGSNAAGAAASAFGSLVNPLLGPLLGGVGSSAYNSLGGVGGALSAGESVAAVVIKVISDWRFIAEVFGGGILVLLGVRLIVSDTTGRPVVPRPNTQAVPLALAAAA